MKPSRPSTIFALLAAIALVAAAAAPAAAAQADDAFDAWNATFLVKANGQIYYSTTTTTAGTMRSGTWVGALDIAVAEDAYERTHSATHRQLVSDLVTTFISKEGTDWSFDSWNDDIAWMVIAVLRGYQITGNAQFLTVAETAWNMAYDRGWDTKYGGGGVWEDMGHVAPFNQPSKCNLSNNPLIKMGVVLYRITGDATYLDKCVGMYAWIRKNLFDAKTGLVNECLAFKTPDDVTGFVQTSDNAYNSGSFLEAADALYRATGDQSYYDDALLAVTHRTTKDAILHDGGQGERQWAYRFVKGLSEFSTYHDMWSAFQPWLEANATAAWNQRNALNVTWNDWTKPTPLPGANGVAHDNDVVPLCTSSAAAIWQVLPPSTAPALSGAFELKSTASGLSLGVGSGAAGVAVAQSSFTGGDDQLWTFVPSAGGTYEIRNAGSGLLLNVEADSYAQGASIVQAAPEPHGQGNDRWLPVANSDGTYSFYSLSSALALDDPTSSSATGTQMDQWSGSSTNAQRFTLIAHLLGGDGGVDAVARDANPDVATNDGARADTAPSGGDAGEATDVVGGASGASGGGDAAGSGRAAGASGGAGSASGCACDAGGSRARPTMVWLALPCLGLLGLVRRRRKA